MSSSKETVKNERSGEINFAIFKEDIFLFYLFYIVVLYFILIGVGKIIYSNCRRVATQVSINPQLSASRIMMLLHRQHFIAQKHVKNLINRKLLQS